MSLPDIGTGTGLLQWGLITAVALFILNVLFESNVRHFLEEHGWDQFLSRAIRKMRPLTERRGFWFAFGLVAGAALVAWIIPEISAPHRPTVAEAVTTALPANSSRLDYWSWEKSYNKQGMFMNAHLINDGKVTAMHVRHLGIMIVSKSESLPDNQIAATLIMLRTQLVAIDLPETEVEPKQNSIWFSVYGTPLSATEIKDVYDGKLYPIAINVLRYTDSTVPSGKFIYTDACVVLNKNDVVVFCRGNYNKSYVAD
jgi:hypothetical protein